MDRLRNESGVYALDLTPALFHPRGFYHARSEPQQIRAKAPSRGPAPARIADADYTGLGIQDLLKRIQDAYLITTNIRSPGRRPQPLCGGCPDLSRANARSRLKVRSRDTAMSARAPRDLQLALVRCESQKQTREY